MLLTMLLVGLIFHEPVNRSTPDLRSATRRHTLGILQMLSDVISHFID
jgi:hypothetical protein